MRALIGWTYLVLFFSGVAFFVLSLAHFRDPKDDALEAAPRAQWALLRLAILWAFSVGVFVLVGTQQHGGQSLIADLGLYAFVPTLGPAALCCISLRARTADRQATRCVIVSLVLSVYTVIAGFSIGLLYLPSAVLLMAAAGFGVFRKSAPARPIAHQSSPRAS